MRLCHLATLACALTSLGATCDHQTEVRPLGASGIDLPDTVADPGGTSARDAPGDPQNEDLDDGDGCDLTGVWAARQVAFNQDTIIGAIQTASQWFVLDVRDDGDAIEFTWSIECGVEVSGSANVLLDRAALPILMRHNPWDGRTGTFRRVGESCALEIEPMYAAIGMAREDAFPTDGTTPPIEELASRYPMPTPDDPTGAQDWDGDGVPGVAYRVSRPISGKRNEVQRWWYRYFSAPGYEIPPGATEFVARAYLETESVVMGVEGCAPLCGLLEAGSVVAPGAEHRIYFVRLGDDLASADPEIVVPGDDLETCYRLQEFMPHDPDER